MIPSTLKTTVMHAQVVADLRTLRTLAEFLLRLDAVTFLAYLESLRASEAVGSVWLFHDAAHTIFEQAKRRVWALQGAPAAGKRKRPASDGGVRPRVAVLAARAPDYAR